MGGGGGGGVGMEAIEVERKINGWDLRSHVLDPCLGVREDMYTIQ